MDPPRGVVAVPMPKALLLLTAEEYIRGLQRGTWWRNQARGRL